jgi:hypothetical protein
VRRSAPPVAAAFGAVLAATWGWWAWKQGAYFNTVLMPGALVLFALAATALLMAPWRLRIRGPAAVALGSLAGIAAWTALSAAWSPAADVAVADAVRAVVYLTAFGLGIAFCHLLGRNMTLSLLPLALAALAVGVATTVTLALGDNVVAYVHGDTTLRFPLGYRNANAAFFLVAFWPAFGLAIDSARDWRLRAAMLATAVLCLDLAVLCQSRGSVLAFAVSVLAYLALCERRVNALAAMALAAIPVVASLPWLLDVYAADFGPPVLDALRPAAGAIALGTLATFGVGLLVARVDPRLPFEASVEGALRRGRVGLAAAALATVAVAFAAFGAGGWIGDRVDEFTAGGYTELPQSTRFSVNTSSNRSDFWRVALDEFADDPLSGGGAGAFRSTYLRQRHSAEAPEDPHSIWMLMASELGVPGVALFLAFCAAATVTAIRSRRLGPQAAALAAAALAAGAYWLTHASLDWFWSYPAVTAPVMAMLGSAAAPGLLQPDWRTSPRVRRFVAAALALPALVAVPLFLSDRYLDYSKRNLVADPAAAFADLDRAQALNPLSDQPYLAEGQLALAQGDAARAETAWRRATQREPEDWVGHYLLGTLLVDREPVLARSELEQARRLNPSDPRVSVALDSLPQ